MAKIWENINGKCYCYGHLMSNAGCHGANCRTCCYNLSPGMISDGHSPMLAEITGFNIGSDYISSGYKRMTVTGNPGAIFSLKSTRTRNANATIPTVDCEVDVLTDVTISNSGTYVFNYNFPATKTIDKYDLKIVPGNHTRLGEHIPKTTPTYSIDQYPNPTITLTSASSTLSGVSQTGDDVTLTGKVSFIPVRAGDDNNNADLNVGIIGTRILSGTMTNPFAGKMSDLQA